MDVKIINPFMEAFLNVMPVLGFEELSKGKLSVKDRIIICNGVILVVGIIGEVKGSVVYNISIEDAKKIASGMMMGEPVTELDQIAKSAISELSNMLSANASIGLTQIGYEVDISTPTFLQGNNVKVTMSTEKVLCVQVLINNCVIDINISVS